MCDNNENKQRKRPRRWRKQQHLWSMNNKRSYFFRSHFYHYTCTFFVLTFSGFNLCHAFISLDLPLPSIALLFCPHFFHLIWFCPSVWLTHTQTVCIHLTIRVMFVFLPLSLSLSLGAFSFSHVYLLVSHSLQDFCFLLSHFHILSSILPCLLPLCELPSILSFFLKTAKTNDNTPRAARLGVTMSHKSHAQRRLSGYPFRIRALTSTHITKSHWGHTK